MARGTAVMRPSGIGMTSQRTRLRMVDRLRAAGIKDETVLAVMAQVPRHMFVEEALSTRAYDDVPLPIGFGQTISSPYIVARMSEMLRSGFETAAAATAEVTVQTAPAPAIRTMTYTPSGGATVTKSAPQTGAPMKKSAPLSGSPGPRVIGKVLEIGTGCGYQTAVLAKLAREVYSVERIGALLEIARNNLRPLRLSNIRLKHSDGMLGLAEVMPFDAIIVTAAAAQAPLQLQQQLAPGGRLLAPVGVHEQQLMIIERTENGFVENKLEAVRFVPLLPGTA
jgi:protein-L-isoaspartate(D-aspartate) O-methyltransferase